MTGHVIRARRPHGDVVLPERHDDTTRWLLDAAYFPGGHADAGYLVRTEGEIAAVLASHAPVLVVGAQSSLTGGATPGGGAVIATERLDAIAIDAESRTARCGAGAVLSNVQLAARDHGLFVAPVPTYDGAFAGGAVATNAAGAATFKYGAMRAAVRALTVVLATGDVLDLTRGAVTAHPDGWFEVLLTSGRAVRVPVPTYHMPAVPKCSAGYFAARGMDVLDLFVGSEGTLGVVTEVTLHLMPRPRASVTCWLPVADVARGLAITAALRDAARTTWNGGDADGLDVPAIESLDRRSIELLRDDGKDREHSVPLPDDAAMVLVFPIELHTPLDLDDALAQLGDPVLHDGPLARLAVLLGDDLDRLELALPGEERKAAAFAALREAVPTCVNHRVRDARLRDPAVSKVAGDFIVPFERYAEALQTYEDAFRARGLDFAIWGHVSDGNVHPNVIPRDAADVARGKEALLELGARVVAMGGSPLAEHGVGRHPVKQAFLRLLYGDDGIAEMRAVKRALDPDLRLAPGVLFPEETA